MSDAAARAAERERGTEHHGISDRFGKGERIVERIGIAASSDFDADIGHSLGEELAILAGFDGGKVAADEFDAEALEHAGSRERHRGVQRRLPPYRGQERVGTLRLDDPLDEFRRDGLDIGAVHERRVGHDGGGIRIHEDDLIALVLEHLACLRSRIIEFAGLAYDDRTRSDDEDFGDVGAFRHGKPPYPE